MIFENHHEPIIDTQTWERVQELRKQRKRPNRYDEVGLFSGILFCADCGSVMYQQRYQTDKRKQDCYICGNYKKRTHDCTAHFIRTDLLTAGVLSNLRKVTSYAAKHEARFMKLLMNTSTAIRHDTFLLKFILISNPSRRWNRSRPDLFPPGRF